MDGVIPVFDPPETAAPPRAPMAMPDQDFAQRPPLRHATRPDRARRWRWLAFAGAAAVTTALSGWIGAWRAQDGLSPLEAALTLTSAATGIWIALAATTALIGLAPRRARPKPIAPGKSLSVALVMPVYHEDPIAVSGAGLAMLRDLAARAPRHGFSLHILSDTRGDTTEERAAVAALRRAVPADMPVHYRWRAANTDRKSGNIADWLRQHGGAQDAMVVLDADSLMGARTLIALADQLAAEPQVALIQTAPRLVYAQSLFARAQAFAGAAYGPLLGRGLARWSGDGANFWGHNAIIRICAFTSAAGLPHLPGRFGRKAQMIWSHDFVEAALLRRRGWSVRLAPELEESYEETPPGLIEHILRDRRWCQGNLQHLRLLGMAGLTPLSRLHLVHGAASYLVSPGWLLLLLGWIALNVTEPTDGMLSGGWPILIAVYGLLLLPKALGVARILAAPGLSRRFGGRARVVGSAAIELALSILFAPIMMVQQSLCIAGLAVGRTIGWNPQNRRGSGHSWRDLLRFHRVETALGVLLGVTMVFGALPLWLIPVAASLILAAPLSRLSTLRVNDRWMRSPQDQASWGVLRRVAGTEAEIATRLSEETTQPLALAAE